MRHPFKILSLCPLDLDAAERVWLAGYSTAQVDERRGYVCAPLPGENPDWRGGYAFRLDERAQTETHPVCWVE